MKRLKVCERKRWHIIVSKEKKSTLMNKKTTRKQKLGQTIIFVLLGIGSAALTLLLWDFFNVAIFEERRLIVEILTR